MCVVACGTLHGCCFATRLLALDILTRPLPPAVTRMSDRPALHACVCVEQVPLLIPTRAMSLVVSLCHTLSAFGISTASVGTLIPILTVTLTPTSMSMDPQN